ncbi:MerR family transcriptional regulator [Fusibacter ferrireducens]|uniref:MerR family transcriptional regulator n=1 Tax=Fusibacter ferrireducens TaxID=2785058 RepID=A0ABR9ZSD8_9FIRM|nr:MerR family transcriptional regulator [Fusibacter ferrireducens]MBF4693384.1 MerR family transcriptional regulator [Fusibacter ferrireducens]
MKYSIGEFSDLLGITIDTIRLYETYGIISPNKDQKSHYRYFDDLDARNLLMSRWYRSLNFSLKVSAKFTLESDYEEIYQQIVKKQKALESELEEKQYLLNRMNAIEAELKNLKCDLGQYKIVKKSKIYRVKQTIQDELIDEGQSKKLIKSLMAALPHTFYSVTVDTKIFSNRNGMVEPNEEVDEYNWGLAIYEPDLDRLGFKDKSDFDSFEANEYLASTICIEYDHKFQRCLFEPLYNECIKLGFRVAGNLIGRLIVIEKVGEKRFSYIEIAIPIER